MEGDFDLLERWRGGDEPAGNALFERHFDALYNFFSNKLPDAVDDLVQKTFLACVEAKERVRDGASFRAYMFVIARRTFYHEIRARRGGIQVDAGVTSAYDLSPSPSQMAAQRDEQRLVLDAMRRIPLEFQVALELFYVQGLRGRELAEVLDIPEPTARSRIRRGLQQVREHIRRMQGDPGAPRASDEEIENWLASLTGQGAST